MAGFSDRLDSFKLSIMKTIENHLSDLLSSHEEVLEDVSETAYHEGRAEAYDEGYEDGYKSGFEYGASQ